MQKILNFKSYINANPFSIWRTKIKKIDRDVSDLFSFRIDTYEMEFVAENNLALLASEKVNCKHILHFFDQEGNASNIHIIQSNELHCRISITPEVTGGAKIGSFLHSVEYDDSTSDLYRSIMKGVSFQHRGYLGFKKDSESFSYVHGNFGGLYIDKNQSVKSLARLRGVHVYTPQFILKPEFNYDLVFSNPTNKKTNIKFILNSQNSSDTIADISIAPFGTIMQTIKSKDIKSVGNVSWETNLPVGRCAVFEYNERYFDVFHA